MGSFPLHDIRQAYFLVYVIFIFPAAYEYLLFLQLMRFLRLPPGALSSQYGFNSCLQTLHHLIHVCLFNY